MIAIPSKSQKSASLLVDALRIISWTTWKAENKNDPENSEKTALELYDIFKSEWDEHEVHGFDLKQLQKLIKDLGYTEEELLNIRKEYWDKRAYYKRTQSSESRIREFQQQYDEPGF